MQKLWPIIPAGFLFLALAALRYQLYLDLGIEFSKAVSVGILLGWYYDLLVILIPFVFAGILGLIRFPIWISTLLGSAVLWMASLANVLYFRFFEGYLEFWVLRYHIPDLIDVRGSATNLGSVPLVLVSSFFFLSCALSIVFFRKNYPTFLDFQKRIKTFGLAILLAGFFLLSRQAPSWFRVEFNSDILSNQIVTLWGQEIFENYRKEDPAFREVLSELSDKKDDSHDVLVRYRDYPSTPSDRPLHRPFPFDLEETVSMRKKLGLPPSGPLNVIVLFMESTRSFEVFHPELSNEVYPELNRVFKKNGIVFTQGYSSAQKSALTVRGQFSTLCSMLPNLTGPATYLAYFSIRIQCLQGLFKKQGYQTTWFHSLSRTYSRMSSFESLHGMDLFFDDQYFKSRGVSEQIGQWGLADKPFLQTTLETLEELSENGKPFFASVLTVSTHHPHSLLQQGQLSPKLLEATKDNPDYQGFLSHHRYADASVGAFFDRFFESSLSENTMVVVLADHGIRVDPHIKLSPVQKKEILFRIPIAIVTKNMPEPKQIQNPVHQVDVAPTVARIVGLKGEMSWVGQGLFSEVGRPWVYQYGDAVHYRVRNKGCYSLPGEKSMQCFQLEGIDPLFNQDLISIEEDSGLTAFFRQVVRANRRLITLNRIIPRSG